MATNSPAVPPTQQISQQKQNQQSDSLSNDPLEQSIEKVLLKSFRRQNLTDNTWLWRIHTGTSAKTWCYRFSIPDSPRKAHTLFLKAYRPGNKPEEKKAEWEVTKRMISRHPWLQQGHHCLFTLVEKWPCNIEMVKPPDKSYGHCDWITNQTDATPPGAIFVEVHDYIEGISYEKILPDMAKRAKLSPTDKEIILSITKVLHRIHSVKPKWESHFETIDCSRFEEKTKRDFFLSTHNLIDRMNYYAPDSNQPHPYITAPIRKKLVDLGTQLVRKWENRSDCSCAQQGDARAHNMIVIVSEGGEIEVEPIDFSRVEWFHRCYDGGRFVADLLEYEISTGSPRYRELIDLFITESEKLSGDKEYREALCIGIFSMLFIKLNPRGTPIQDPQVAKKYLDFCMRVLKQGYFSWK